MPMFLKMKRFMGSREEVWSQRRGLWIVKFVHFDNH
jgi:hypothetical protein